MTPEGDFVPLPAAVASIAWDALAVAWVSQP
jgi:hypothetical protein